MRSKLVVITLVMVALQFAATSTAEAGPLLDWLRGLRPNAQQNRCCQPPTRVNAYRPQVAAGVANPYNLQPGQCARTCNKVCTRTVVNYVPCTAYRTSWKQVPVTSYKPQTSSDPCTGCTVTCMKPCTTYTWQMQRVPYTTYRPQYRQESYTVPVTTITNDCATGNCGTCPTGDCSTGTCGTPTYPGQVNSGYVYPGTNALPQASSVITAPNGTLNTNGSYQTVPGGQPIQQYGGSAADSVPFIDSNINPQINQRPIIDRIETLPMEGTSYQKPSDYRAANPINNNNVYPINQQQAPAVVNFNNLTAKSPVRKKWSYSPVRQASYTSIVKEPTREKVQNGPVKIRGSFQSNEVTQTTPSTKSAGAVNAAWNTVEW